MSQVAIPEEGFSSAYEAFRECPDGEIPLVAALYAVAPFILRQAADELDADRRRLPYGGRHTRAGWAINGLRLLADAPAVAVYPDRAGEDK